jgi:DNA-binding transcriptional regulator YbjK
MTRRSDLADAAIETLAAAGMRGLTHRAVDHAAGLPEGSTSYYFRTRPALLQAVVERLAELIAADIPALPVTDLDAATEAITTIIETGATTGRSRHVARYELILEAVRRPELRAALTASWAVVQEAVAEQLAALGLTDPAAGLSICSPSSTGYSSRLSPGPWTATWPPPACGLP